MTIKHVKPAGQTSMAHELKSGFRYAKGESAIVALTILASLTTFLGLPLLTICLMITGQHVSENAAANSMSLGLGLIWTGNVIVFALAAGLLGYLRKQ